jgi:hypothetical protein
MHIQRQRTELRLGKIIAERRKDAFFQNCVFGGTGHIVAA